MELRHLRYFVAVAEELHFGRAAIRLSIAQPPLSQQIRHLEETLHITLLRRTKRSVQLTSAGRIFLDEARATLAQAERAVMLAQRAARGEVGHLSVGCVPWADYTSLSGLLHTFGERYPEVELELHSMASHDQVTALRDGRIQVAITNPPVNGASLVTEPLFTDLLVVAVPHGHRFTMFDEICWRELAAEPYIACSDQLGPAYNAVVATACAEAGISLRIRHEADHMQTILALVEAGVGISLLPASVMRVSRAGIAFRRMSPSGPMLATIIASQRNQESRLVQSFLDVVHEVRNGSASA